MNRNVNRKTIILINVILGQALVVAINGMWGVYAAFLPINIPIRYVTTFSLLAGVILAFVAIFLIKEVLRLAQKETEAEIHNVSLNKSKELLDVMRAQRHDFLNHIQVIYGLAQLKKIEILSSYIGELIGDIETESWLGNLAQPEFAAFLIRKKSYAIEQGIKFNLDVFTDLRNLRIPPTDLIRIIGNLIDNAFYEVIEHPVPEGRVLLTIDEQNGYYCFSVANTGKEISDNVKKEMFQQGFTTKGKRGSGLGLHIVKELVDKNSGCIGMVHKPEFAVCLQVKMPISTSN